MIAWIPLATHTVKPVSVGILDLAKQYYDLGYRMIRIYFQDSESAPVCYWDFP